MSASEEQSNAPLPPTHPKDDDPQNTSSPTSGSSTTAAGGDAVAGNGRVPWRRRPVLPVVVDEDGENDVTMSHDNYSITARVRIAVPGEDLRQVSRTSRLIKLLSDSSNRFAALRHEYRSDVVVAADKNDVHSIVEQIPVDELWAAIRLTLNQVTTASVEHVRSVKNSHTSAAARGGGGKSKRDPTSTTNSDVAISRPDFLLVNALYPIASMLRLQQHMLSYYLQFPLPRTAAAVNQAFITVFVDSFEAFGGDVHYAYWFLLASICPRPETQEEEAAFRGDTIGYVDKSLRFMTQGLEPLLNWQPAPEGTTRDAYNAHMGVLVADSTSKANDAETKRVAWFVLCDFATRGAFHASVFIEAFGRHPRCGFNPAAAWTQIFSSIQVAQRNANRRVDWRNHSSRLATKVMSNREGSSSRSGETRGAELMVAEENFFSGSGWDVFRADDDDAKVAVDATREVPVDDHDMCDDNPDVMVYLDSGLLVHPQTAHKRFYRSFRIFAHRIPRHSQISPADWVDEHPMLLQDYHIMIVLLKLGLLPDLAWMIVDEWCYCPPKSALIRAGQLFALDFCRGSSTGD